MESTIVRQSLPCSFPGRIVANHYTVQYAESMCHCNNPFLRLLPERPGCLQSRSSHSFATRAIRGIHRKQKHAFTPGTTHPRPIRAKSEDLAKHEETSRSPEELQQTQGSLKPWTSLKWRVVSLWGSGAILGPLLDGRHSTHNVLHYEDPTVIHLGSFFQLETCWWVPLLFGGAAVILGIGHPLLDSRVGSNKGPSLLQGRETSAQPRDESRTVNFLRDEPTGGYVPTWSFVLVSIALFALQYDLSGLLAEKATNGELPWATVNIALAATAVAHWGVFDRTSNGLFWAALTAFVGPIVEIGLIQGLHLYHYTHPDIFGIPFWIPWVYWCGAPAVGNLGRRVCGSIR